MEIDIYMWQNDRNLDADPMNLYNIYAFILSGRDEVK